MAFLSPAPCCACSAIALVHKELIGQSTISASSPFPLRVKQEQLARDVHFLVRSALDDTLFCEDMALIEHLFARAQKEVPAQIRQLMRAPLHIEHLLGEVEARAALRDFDALRTFLHEEQVTPPLAVASDGGGGRIGFR